jgi:hypothetical protein
MIRYYVMYRPPQDVSEILQNNDVVLFAFGLHCAHFRIISRYVSDFERDTVQFVSRKIVRS